MAANRDEALKCIAISQRHLNAGNLPSARKFAEKSISLYPTSEAKQLLELVAQRETEPSTSTSASDAGTSAESTFASGAQAHPTEEAIHKRHPQPRASSSRAANGAAEPQKKREYTPEQAAVVNRIRRCQVTEYYEIMALQKDCEEADVKKAYRKLALQLHPDKNGAPGADEAFKLVSKAFQVLSDPQKRAIYDQHGSDPDSRFAGMSTSSPFGPPGAGGAAFGEEISPEDLFNMFFGGGGGAFGGGFGGGPVFTANFGRGGFQTFRMGGMGAGFPRQRQRQQGQQAQQGGNSWIQLLPFLFIFILPILSNIFSSLFSTPPVPDPSYTFSKSTQFSALRLTTPHKVPYYVHQATFTKHPVFESIPSQYRDDNQAGRGVPRGSPLSLFETRIEERFASSYYDQCSREYQRKQREIEREQGFFGIGADTKKIKEIESRKIESCEILKQYGFIS